MARGAKRECSGQVCRKAVNCPRSCSSYGRPPPLVRVLRTVPGCSPYMYADDTATLCADATIETARSRAQSATDKLVAWARESKMTVSGVKTQVLVLSQWARDTVGLSIRVAGAVVMARETLNLLLAHSLRPPLQTPEGAYPPPPGASATPHRKRLGPGQTQTANGYVPGALEHATAAWLPATPPSHVEVLEREMREAARIITGCMHSTTVHALLAETGMTPVADRRTTLAARFMAKARALPAEYPLRRAAEAAVSTRLRSVTGWRQEGLEAWSAAGITAPIEPVTPVHAAPRTEVASVMFDLEAGRPLPPGAPRRYAAGKPRSTWSPSPRKPSGSGRTARRLEESWTEAQAPSSCGPTERSRRSAPQQAGSARATGRNWWPSERPSGTCVTTQYIQHQ